ncbi:Lar family restriction alleviation protein [Eggerthella sinensis]|uniref:Lar family restriction alleviation protein n=1 Tax=Eggerthella sinensis TaxID=242230 RepID=UPI00266BEE16|nr:Lar family restriction alleviation protein [Eggerthella sinensis]
MDESDLLPCPFCGCEAHMHDLPLPVLGKDEALTDASEDVPTVVCSGCGARTTPRRHPEPQRTAAEVAALWNRRASVDHSKFYDLLHCPFCRGRAAVGHVDLERSDVAVLTASVSEATGVDASYQGRYIVTASCCDCGISTAPQVYPSYEYSRARAVRDWNMRAADYAPVDHVAPKWRGLFMTGGLRGKLVVYALVVVVLALALVIYRELSAVL